MIKIEEYLTAKKITDQYELENKKSAGRPPVIFLNINQKKEVAKSIFSKEKELSYLKLIYFISETLGTGITSSKKIAKDLKNSNMIIQDKPKSNYKLGEI